MRQATAGDIPRLVEMARRFHMAKQAGLEFVADDAAASFEWAVNSGVVYIASDGFIAGIIASDPWDQSRRVCHELFWWSEGRDGMKLKKKLEEWACDSGCAEVQFSHPASEKTVGKIMKRSGYTEKTTVWSKLCV